MPTESEEVWRYSPIDELDLDSFTPVATGTALSEEGSTFSDSMASRLGALSGHVTVHNGRPGAFGGSGSDGTFAFGGTTHVADAAGLLGSVQVGGDALVRLNDAFLPDAAIVDVPGGVVVPYPILIVHWCDGSGSAAFPRTAIRLGANAQAEVIEVFAGPSDGARSLVVPVTELTAGEGARLSYVSLQVLSDSVWSIGRLSGAAEKDATLRTFTVGLGADYDRVRTDIAARGRGAHCEILSAYVGNGTQVHDIRTLQDHVAPRTTSELLCQGAVAGNSRSVYSGLIRVHRGAVRTDARQTNHNLVLDEGAHADSVPNLDILENDVKCSHASTVGPIDEDQRYYIESRGVAPEVAEGLIVQGFFDAIIDRGPVAAASALLQDEVHARLDIAFANRRLVRESAHA
jgi:Fe-S cluster assembly protein SufD